MSNFGIWAMLAFWGSAIGGILFAIAWGRAKRNNPASRDMIAKSLKQRLEAGEITQAEFDRRMEQLGKERK
jgi:putative membrane protein